jgi:hypothetical protein
MEQKAKFYLMTAGTLLPAFVGLNAYTIVTKKEIDKTAILLFAGLAIVGGYFSAKILKGK